MRQPNPWTTLVYVYFYMSTRPPDFNGAYFWGEEGGGRKGARGVEGERGAEMTWPDL